MKRIIAVAFLTWSVATLGQTANQKRVKPEPALSAHRVNLDALGLVLADHVPLLTAATAAQLEEVRSIVQDGASPTSPDNSSAIQTTINAVAAVGGGTVFIPQGTYITKRDLVMKSNVQIMGEGAGSVIEFEPTCPCREGVNRDAFFLHGSLTHRRQIAAAVPVGATSFSLASASDGSDLTPGEWLMLQEYDQRAGPNQVVSEWAQVSSVSGRTVNLAAPVQTAIPDLRPWNNTPGSWSGAGFYGVPSPVTNVSIRNLKILVPSNVPGNGQLGTIVVGQAVRFADFSHLVIDNDTNDGSAFYTYLASMVFLDHDLVLASKGRASEFAATDGLTITDSLFTSTVTANSPLPLCTAGSAIALDDGTQDFVISDNQFTNGRNDYINLVTGTRNGSIVSNQFGYLSGTSPGTAINAYGLQNTQITGNSGEGGVGNAVSLENSATYSINIPSQGNTVFGNSWNNYARGNINTTNASALDNYISGDNGMYVLGLAATAGTQLQIGRNNSIQDSIGSIASSGDPFIAYNAKQTKIGTDQWTQVLERTGSSLVSLDQHKGICFYSVEAGRSPGKFTSFWGRPLFCVSSRGTLSIGDGRNAVYRCTVDGRLPTGALTTVPSDCGRSLPTGLNTN